MRISAGRERRREVGVGVGVGVEVGLVSMTGVLTEMILGREDDTIVRRWYLHVVRVLYGVEVEVDR